MPPDVRVIEGSKRCVSYPETVWLWYLANVEVPELDHPCGPDCELCRRQNGSDE